MCSNRGAWLRVEQLYGDSALSEALNIVLHLSLSIPVNELMAYPKVYTLACGYPCAVCMLCSPLARCFPYS